MLMKAIDWWMVAIFFAIVVAIPLVTTFFNRGTSKDFLLAGRSMPWWLLGFSMTAACTSTDSANLFTEIIRKDGLAGNWVWWAFLITSVFTVFVYSKLWVRTGVTTDVEFYELRYSGKPAVFLRALRGVYLGVILNLLVMGAVVLGGLKIGVILFGCSSTTILIFTGIFSIVYVALAGMRGIVYTDFFLFIVIMVGAFAAMFYALGLPEVGGLAGMAAHPALQGKLSIFPDFSNTDAVFAVLVIPLAVQWWGVWKQGAEPGGGGYIVQRIMSAKSEQHAVGGTLFFNFIHYAIRPWPWYVVGFCSLIVFPQLSDIQKAFPHVESSLIGGDMAYSAMLTKVPPGWFGIVVASMMAALFSTVAAHLNMGASYVVNDFYRRFMRPTASDRELIWAARVMTVVFMVLACLIAPLLTSAKTAFDLMLLIGAGSGPIFLLRWFWMRINAWSEIVGILSALTTAIVLDVVLPNCGCAPIVSWKKLLIGVGVTTVSWLVATCVTKPEPIEVQTRFKSLVRAKGRDVGLGVLWTFLASTAIIAWMAIVAALIK